MNTHEERWLEAGGLAVRFVWRRDRFAHEVCLREGDGWRMIATSVEGSPEEEWPASPPFQSLHVECREDGREVALLVGMAGKSHWSASIEIDAAASCVCFDVACRLHTAEPGPLGSTYHAPAEGQCGGITIELGQRFGTADLECEEPATLRVAPQIASEDGPQTVRWDYRVRPVST